MYKMVDLETLMPVEHTLDQVDVKWMVSFLSDLPYSYFTSERTIEV